MLIPAGTRFITFVGNLISVEEHNAKRQLKLQQGYTLYLPHGLVLDCFESGQDGRCLAMMANSPRKLMHSITGLRAKANAKLVLVGNVAYLKSLVNIPRNTEILYSYGTIYRDYV